MLGKLLFRRGPKMAGALKRPLQQVRHFSGFQTEMEKFDFTDKLNTQELGLQNPNQL